MAPIEVKKICCSESGRRETHPLSGVNTLLPARLLCLRAGKLSSSERVTSTTLKQMVNSADEQLVPVTSVRRLLTTRSDIAAW